MPPASPEHRFSDRVGNYVRYRPGYPAELLPVLVREAGLTAESRIADIGSGTGISSELFLKAGFRVTGVEPNAPMREAADRQLAGYPGFESVAGSAQATTLAEESIDLIVAAQAFHWFATPETRAEFDRILRPGGHVALIWNVRLIDSTPFLRGYEDLLLRHGTDYAEIRHENIDEPALAAFFRGPFATFTFANFQTFDFESLKGRLLSSSYSPAPGHPSHEPMLMDLRRLFEIHARDGRVTFDYETRLHLGC
jgi:SAM-dependent methyltransferase